MNQSQLPCLPPDIKTPSNLAVPPVRQEANTLDVLLWPCGTVCYRHELAEFNHLSDDYLILKVGSDAWHAFEARQDANTQFSPASRYLLSHPNGTIRRICPALPAHLSWSCWNDLFEASFQQGYRS